MSWRSDDLVKKELNLTNKVMPRETCIIFKIVHIINLYT